MSLPALLVATSNVHKLHEFRTKMLSWQVLGLEDLDIHTQIEETGSTLQENALLKAKYLYNIVRMPVIAEDTGLEVYCLDNEPGVRSARYAGDHAQSEQNMDLLLANMARCENRDAQFRTVICHIDGQGNVHYYEGIVKGRIARKKTGNLGFGYDPIFIPLGYDISFAEMNVDIKNTISHRAIAIDKMMSAFNGH